MNKICAGTQTFTSKYFVLLHILISTRFTTMVDHQKVKIIDFDHPDTLCTG